MKLVRVYKYRLYPATSQVRALELQLDFARELYNAAVEQRRFLWRSFAISISHKEQSPQLTELRRDSPELAPIGMSRSMMQKTLERVDAAFKTYFRRLERGERAGYPRYKSRSRFHTLRAQAGRGCKLQPSTRRLYWSGVGEIKVKLHRPLPPDAEVKEISVKRQVDGWYVCVGMVIEARDPLAPTGAAVGVDLGIRTFAALSTGELIHGPRAHRRVEQRLKSLQRSLARRTRGSNRWNRERRDLSKSRLKEKRVRRDHHHKLARRLVRDYDVIVLERLNIKGLADAMLAKDVRDQGWGQFIQILADKAEEAGRRLVFVDPGGTSRECSSCGALVDKNLGQRIHACGPCGVTLDRDVNAARNILRRGERQQVSLDGAASPQATAESAELLCREAMAA